MAATLVPDAADAHLFPGEAQTWQGWGGGRCVKGEYLNFSKLLLHRVGDKLNSELQSDLIKAYLCTAQTHNSGYLVKAACGCNKYILL